jgi:hypothetical protein
MTQRDHETPNLGVGKWLLTGLIAIVALAGITIWFANFGDEVAATETTVGTILPGGGDQVEWSILVGELAPSPGEVTLKGDTPLGFPTETWRDGVMLARAVNGDFEWNMDESPELPTAVYEINQAESCDDLQTLLDQWAQEVAQATGDARRAQSSAFAQHAVDTMTEMGCQIDLG